MSLPSDRRVAILIDLELVLAKDRTPIPWAADILRVMAEQEMHIHYLSFRSAREYLFWRQVLHVGGLPEPENVRCQLPYLTPEDFLDSVLEGLTTQHTVLGHLTVRAPIVSALTNNGVRAISVIPNTLERWMDMICPHIETEWNRLRAEAKKIRPRMSLELLAEQRR